MTEQSPLAAQVIGALAGRRYRYVDEKALHEALSTRLTEAGIEHEREVKVHGGRIDFAIGSLGVEVKIKGSALALERQVRRYAVNLRFDEFLVITTRPAHAAIAAAVSGKPVWLLNIGGLSL